MKQQTQTLIEEKELDALAIGANILGSGGGGDPGIDLIIAKECIAKWGPVILQSFDNFPDDAWIAPIGYMGAPMVCLEKIPSGREFPLIIEQLKNCNRPISALIPFEIGGSNAFAPFCTAAMLNLPVLDADTFGRAFPEMCMSASELAGISPSPAIIVDNNDQFAILHANDGKSMERLLRSITTSMGASAAICSYSMTGSQAKSALIKGSISTAIEMGNAFLKAQESGNCFAPQLLKPWNVKYLFEGTIVDISSCLTNSFLKGHILIEKESCQWTVHFQNEFLAVESENKFLATTPDIIAIFDKETGFPLPIERIFYGCQVCVCTLPAPGIWQTADGLALVGPRSFGYPCDYQLNF